MDTLSNLYQQDINYYAQINFIGMETLVDAVGGVDVYSEQAFTTLHGKYPIVQGNNHLNGSQAVGFARERYAFTNGDNQRGKNQMKVLTAVIDKLSAATVLTNYNAIMQSLSGMFITDMSSGEITSLVKMQLNNPRSWHIHSFAVSGTGGKEHTYSMPSAKAYVMFPNEAEVEHASELIDKVIAGESLTEADLQK